MTADDCRFITSVVWDLLFYDVDCEWGQQVHHGCFKAKLFVCPLRRMKIRLMGDSQWSFPRMSWRSPWWKSLIYSPGNEPGANSGRGFCVPPQSSVSVLKIEVWHILMFNCGALWGPLNEQHELYWTLNKEHQLQVTVLISVAIANRLTEIQQQLSLVNLNMHNPNICIWNKQLSSQGISHALAFEIYTLPANFIQ